MTDNISNVTLGTDDINKVFLGDSLVWRRFSIESLHSNGEQGAWFDPSDLSTLFKDVAGTVSITRDGEPVVLMRDKSGNGNHAVQSVSTARPIYKDDPARLSLDSVDDAIVINLPSHLVGTMTLATTTGTATYGVDIPSGDFTLGGKFFPSKNIVGLILREGKMSANDESKVDSYLLSKGAVKSFAGITRFTAVWRSYNLTSFPLIDTSNGTNFSSAWHYNKLTSFPSIDLSSGTNFSFAWASNNSLVDFPEHMFDNVKGGDFSYAFSDTNLSQSSIDGILVSLVTSGIATGVRNFHQSGGSAPSTIGQDAIDTLRSRGWKVIVTGSY